MIEAIDEAIPLLIYDKTTKNFTLTEKGESIIKDLPCPFGVITVAGMYRTGKSYLLNRMLLNRSSGFSVGPTINPCTKGLWMWSSPIRSLSDENMPIIVIDTEGFGAFDEDHNHDVRIFTLSILLSSFFIYNSVGSIDENSIQSLSFVINLSNHIQMKMGNNINNSEKNEVDHLSEIFPNFLWVIRDFSLQLINENSEEISDKEYLENVLDEKIKSISNEDPKNKIRTLIKSYFKNRDCHTLIRPLMEEDQLQNLANIPFEDLRAEFVHSVYKLRKKVLNNVKPKSLKGKTLNGEMFVNIIKSIISSINAGTIPSIDNTWNMICKIETNKALEFSEKIYDDFIKDKFDSVNISERDLYAIHQEAKIKCIDHFRKKAVGEISIEYEKNLKIKVKEKFNFYKTINEEEIKNHLTKILQKHYSLLEYKIHSNQIKSVTEIENEFRNLESEINENYSEFRLKQEMLFYFKYKILNFFLEFFQNISSNEIILLTSKLNELREKYNNELIEINSSFEKDLLKKNNQIETLKTEIYTLKCNYSILKEEYALLQTDKDQQNKILNDKLINFKEESERIIKELNEKIAFCEDKQRDAERKAITIQGELDKQKALLDQKIDNYSKQIDDYNKREKESVIELRIQIKEQQLANKDSNSKYENLIRTLNNELDELREKVMDYETSISGKESLLELEKSKAEEINIKRTIEINDLKEKVESLKNKILNEKNKSCEELKSKENEFTNKLNISLNKIEEIELKYKICDDSAKCNLMKFEREIAILKQGNEFLELQLKELNNQLEDQKRSHDSILSKLEIKAFSQEGQEEFNRKIEELKEFFSNEKKQLNDNFEKSRQLYLTQIDSINEKSNEIECILKVEREDFQKELNELKTSLDKSKRDNDLLNKENQVLIENAQVNNDDIQRKIRKLTVDYEKKLEEKEQKYQREQVELNRNSEETINQLKNLFETEKYLFEEKLREEKSKTERKIKSLSEEYENKLSQQEAELREQIDNLSEDFQIEIENLKNYASQSEHQVGLLQQKIESLEQNLIETKDSLNRNQIQSRQLLEKEIDNFKKDRYDFLLKIEGLNNENNNKDKELTSLRMKKDQIEYLLQEKDNYSNLIKKEFDEDKKDLQNKIENIKSKLQCTNDDFMIKKLEFTRENALLKQQIEFQDRKIEELQRNIEENQKKYEEKLFSLRNEVERDLTEKYDRIKRDRDDFEAKFLGKKKEMRDLEQNYFRQSTLVEKDKAILNEKINALENKKKEIIDNYEKELELISTSFKTMKDEKLKENDVYHKEIETLRKKNFALEQINNEIKSSNEKDKLLWEGRLKFLESQREQSKKDLLENQRKFENIFENFQKKTVSDKEKLESNHNYVLSNLEKKFQSEIYDLKENHQKLYTDLLNLNKDLERELKGLNLQQELRNKSLDPSAISKRISDLLEVQDRMKKELDECRREKDSKISEIQKMCEREKEILKVKINDIENRLREVEAKRGHLMLEYEKDKAKFSLEKDHLESKNKELQDTLDRLEKKIENLLRENEKFRNDKTVSNNNSISKRNSSTNYRNIISNTNNNNNSTILPNYNNVLNNSTINPMVERDLNSYNQPKLYNPFSTNNVNYVKPTISSNLEKSFNNNESNNSNNDSNNKVNTNNIYYQNNNKNSNKFAIRQFKQNPNNDK